LEIILHGFQYDIHHFEKAQKKYRVLDIRQENYFKFVILELKILSNG